MKIKTLTIALLSALASVSSVSSAHAEVKPAGTILDNLCGTSHSFPRATEVCLASAVDSNIQYLGIASYNSEYLGVAADRNMSYYRIDSIKTAEDGSVVYAASVATHQGSYLVEMTYELVVKNNIARLNRDGRPVFGAGAIELQPMFHTL